MDSEGQFTLGFADARRKLTQFGSANKDRYLLLIVSAVIAQGASRIDIERDDFELKFRAAGVYFSTQQIRGGFESLLAQGGGSAALDLAIGLNGAFMLDALEVTVQSCHPVEPCFRWTLSEDSEDVEPLPPSSEHALSMTICFQKRNVLNQTRSWFRQAGGHSVVGRESELVARLCPYSLVDIAINSVPVKEGIRVPEAPIAIFVKPESHRSDHFTLHTWGDPREKAGQLLEKTATNWFGWVSLQRGDLHFVIHGITYTVTDGSMGLSGVIYCDGLQRDITRESVVKNAFYTELFDQLDDFRLEMVQKLRLDDVKVEWKGWVAEQARDLAEQDKLDYKLLEKYAGWLDNPRWLKAQAGLQLALTRTSRVLEKPGRVDTLLSEALEKALAHLRREKDDLAMLDLCIEIFEGQETESLWDWLFLAGLAALSQKTEVAVDRFSKCIQELTAREQARGDLRLPLAYLGLGFGHWKVGDEGAAREAWDKVTELTIKKSQGFSTMAKRMVSAWTSEPPTADVEALADPFWDLGADPESTTEICRPDS